ncbi:hypothetical protein RchiOBHm_Chr2g0144951 [Rosa chinensis]|uniref:Uncharacterized protein n=1 Tax=Rosa chinensis TaxID=74649 RepID=A0A2P6RYJ1_ROSCH|nr:hypothetical protein RchiOBHm_Chr2g0144951 [Rosa chinensis]
MENRVHKQLNITSTYGGISSSSSTYCYVAKFILCTKIHVMVTETFVGEYLTA